MVGSVFVDDDQDEFYDCLSVILEEQEQEPCSSDNEDTSEMDHVSLVRAMEAGDSPVLLPLTLVMSQGREKDDGSTKNHSTSFQEKEPLATSREEFADPKWTESPKSNNTLKDTNLQCRHHQPPPLAPAKGYGQVAVVPTEHPSDTVPHCGTEISGPTRLLNDSTNFPQQFNSDHPTIGNSSNRSRQHHLDHVDSQQQQDDESSSACKDDTGQGTCGPILAGSHDDCDKKDKERNSETSNDNEQGAFVGRRNMDHAPPTKPNEPSPPLGIQSKEERSAIGPPEDKKHDEEKEYPTAVSDKTPLEGTVVPHKLVKSVTRTPRLQRRRSMGSSVSLASMDSQKNSLFQENMSLPSSSSRMAANYRLSVAKPTHCYANTNWYTVRHGPPKRDDKKCPKTKGPFGACRPCQSGGEPRACARYGW